jgi:hypothetical protein
MRSNRVLMGIIFALVVLGLSVAAGAQKGNDFGVGTTRHVTFDQAVRVQGQLVPAGDYVVEHVMEGQNHIMVFKRLPRRNPEFKFACNMVKLENKAKQSTKVYDTASGNMVLKSITFAGDSYEHVFGE